MPIVTYTNSNPGTIVDCFPVAGSLANWLTQKVRLIEGTAPNTGRWTGDLFAGNWAVFESGDTPISFEESVGTIFVESSETIDINLDSTPDVIEVIVPGPPGPAGPIGPLGPIVLNDKLVWVPPASETLTVNGQFTIETISNTQVRLKLRGSDGVSRIATITLS